MNPKAINFPAMFQRLWNYIIYGGSSRVHPLQRKLLDAFLPSLKPAVRVQVETQLMQPFTMQFWHSGQISPFFFKDKKLALELQIPDSEFSDRLYQVEMFVGGRKQNAHVTFFEGRIFSLEFKQPLKFYDGKDIRFGTVTLGKTTQSVTVGIDRREHGKNGRIATGED